MEYLSHANLSDTACDSFCSMIFGFFLTIKALMSHDSMPTLDTEILYLYLGKLNFSTWRDQTLFTNVLKSSFKSCYALLKTGLLVRNIFVFKRKQSLKSFLLDGPGFWYSQKKRSKTGVERVPGSLSLGSRKRKVKTPKQHTPHLNTLMK